MAATPPTDLLDLPHGHGRLGVDHLRRTDDPIGWRLLRRPVGRPASGVDDQERLQQGVDRLPRLVEGCDHASVTTVAGGQPRVRAMSDAVARRADELQDDFDEGPCLQAVRTGHSVVAPDLRTEPRWPDWCSAVVDELEVAAVLTVLLLSTQRPLATLNLYSRTVAGLARVDIARLHDLAGPLADALLAARWRVDGLGPAA